MEICSGQYSGLLFHGGFRRAVFWLLAFVQSHWSAILVGGDVSGRLAPFGFSEFFTGSRCVVVPLERVDRERECVC